MRNVPFLSLGSIFFFLGGLSSEVDHFPLLNFWMPVPSLNKRILYVVCVLWQAAFEFKYFVV
jgi:hypothetical protein